MNTVMIMNFNDCKMEIMPHHLVSNESEADMAVASKDIREHFNFVYY